MIYIFWILKFIVDLWTIWWVGRVHLPLVYRQIVTYKQWFFACIAWVWFFASECAWCFVRLLLWENDLSHTSHAYGFSPVCVCVGVSLKCNFQRTICIIHCIGFSPVWHMTAVAYPTLPPATCLSTAILSSFPPSSSRLLKSASVPHYNVDHHFFILCCRTEKIILTVEYELSPFQPACVSLAVNPLTSLAPYQ